MAKEWKERRSAHCAYQEWYEKSRIMPPAAINLLLETLTVMDSVITNTDRRAILGEGG
jgi:hypothetical protein